MKNVSPLKKQKRITGSVVLFLFLLLFVWIQGCSSPATLYTETGFYLNTVITITVYRQKDARLIQECFALCENYENMLSRTVESSDIYRINHSGGMPIQVSPETASLLAQALFYARLSGGRIDPTVAPLMELWNFTGQTAAEPSGQNKATAVENTEKNSPAPPDSLQTETESDLETKNRIPEKNDILALLPHIHYKAIQTEGLTVTLTDPESQIDLGFIAKGYIADRLKEYLVSQGVSSAVLNLGGNILTIGKRPDGEPFQIGLQKPFGSQGETLAVLPVSDQSVVSSGIYERCFEENGRLYHHLLDPATGYPVENGLLGVTILSDSSMEGDALSTTCFCMGPEEGMALVESLPNVEAIFITEDYTLHTSSGITLP